MPFNSTKEVYEFLARSNGRCADNDGGIPARTGRRGDKHGPLPRGIPKKEPRRRARKKKRFAGGKMKKVVKNPVDQNYKTVNTHFWYVGEINVGKEREGQHNSANSKAKGKMGSGRGK